MRIGATLGTCVFVQLKKLQVFTLVRQYQEPKFIERFHKYDFSLSFALSTRTVRELTLQQKLEVRYQHKFAFSKAHVRNR